MTCLFRQMTFYITGLQIFQLILYFLFAKFKGQVVGNVLYWFGLFYSITSVLYLYCYDISNYAYSKGGKCLY